MTAYDERRRPGYSNWQRESAQTRSSVGSNPTPGMKIRHATRDDARAIATVQVAGWRAAYRGIVPDAVLDELSVEGRTEKWVEILGSGSLVLVAEDGGEVVGWTAAWLAEGEIKGLYVLPDRLRRGIGTALLRAAHQQLAAAGREEAVLWVFEQNAPARAFYAVHGYVADGARMVHADSGAAEVRLWTSLGAE
jgi:GNAT superfamily N-acetyltransferase